MTEEQRPYISIPPAKIEEHHYRCPICHEVVDVRDLDETARHLEPGHSHTSKKFSDVLPGE